MAKVSTPVSFENEISISGAVLSKNDLRDNQELPKLEGPAPGWACERRIETLENLFALHILFSCIYFSSCIYFQASFHLETQQVQAGLQVHLVPNWLPEVEGSGFFSSTGSKHLASRLPCSVFLDALASLGLMLETH